jgi:hypothetical protein
MAMREEEEEEEAEAEWYLSLSLAPAVASTAQHSQNNALTIAMESPFLFNRQ